MDIKTLTAETPKESLKLVAVKLPEGMVDQLRRIRTSTGKTNTEVYASLIGEGLMAYKSAVDKKKSRQAAKKNGHKAAPVNGKKRGRPPKAKKVESRVAVASAIDNDADLD